MKKKDILPEITFKQIPLEFEVEMFFDFLEGGWNRMITEKYPQFLKIKKIKEKKERKLAIKNEIVKIRTELGSELDKNLEIIKSSWQKIEVECLQELPNIIQTDWPDREITAYVSLNPVCPRHLDSWRFSVTHDRKNTNVVIAHEISHFLYFKKFKEIFPKISNENYESPHKEWLLSELVAVIVSHDPRMFKIIGVKDDFYQEHKKMMVNGELLTEKIEKLYKEYVMDKNDFSEFIKKGMEIVRKIR